MAGIKILRNYRNSTTILALTRNHANKAFFCFFCNSSRNTKNILNRVTVTKTITLSVVNKRSSTAPCKSTFPGKLEDECYAGCNMLIAENMAQLARSAEHISMDLGWYPEAGDSDSRRRQTILANLPVEKQEILKVLRQCGEMDAARIAASCSYGISQTSYLLLEMEIEGLVKHISTNKYVYL